MTAFPDACAYGVAMSTFPYVAIDRGIRVLLAERTEHRAQDEVEKRLEALIVVGPDQPELFEALRTRYADTAGVTVITDRRGDLPDRTASQERRHDDANLWIEGYLVVPRRSEAAGLSG
jgi:hypothetical protein